ncbi:MAG: tRNA uridine-5-carboxymethylaminomethyl(34) synthesis GTPase MnmE, partial [Cyanobacteriota bacterium]|nr:tRNA uridine-5-carboxymethylaminomethyl(34) synthesis GTPase MnmE [Cyanobacteriota bacterium]
VLQLCLEAGARLAQPGEFTLRAFLNGRIDLTQAESVADLVNSQSQTAAQAALAGLEGKLATPIKQFRATCLDVLAEIEARIDFEEDLPPLDVPEIISKVNQISAELSILIETAEKGERLRSGLNVAIVGRPNVGKSSLLNAWSQSDRAIVTDLPGTTRDVVESQLVVGGIPIKVLDTAGIRTSEDQVEKIGIERSHRAAQLADLVLLTLDAEAGWTEYDQDIYQQIQDHLFIIILNKIDRVSASELELKVKEISEKINQENLLIVKTAAAFNQGIEELETAILTAVNLGNLQAANLDIALNQRQTAVITQAKTALDRMKITIENQLPLDFWTIDLRDAIQALGEVTGEEVTESVLDRIFSRFCIGK